MVTLSSQPKSTAVGPDGSVFVAEIAQIEVFRSNQKISDLSVEYGPSSVAVGNETVAVGGEVRAASCCCVSLCSRILKDKKIHLYNWTDDTLKEVGTLEENRGTISAISFSPDGSLLAAGDVSPKLQYYIRMITRNRRVRARSFFITFKSERYFSNILMALYEC